MSRSTRKHFWSVRVKGWSVRVEGWIGSTPVPRSQHERLPSPRNDAKHVDNLRVPPSYPCLTLLVPRSHMLGQITLILSSLPPKRAETGLGSQKDEQVACTINIQRAPGEASKRLSSPFGTQNHTTNTTTAPYTNTATAGDEVPKFNVLRYFAGFTCFWMFWLYTSRERRRPTPSLPPTPFQAKPE